MKVLHFTFRGEAYRVDERGCINANGIDHYSDSWIFLGGSTHHWHNRVTVTLIDAFNNPKALDGCYGWDRDHGTIRAWGGLYYGKVPRIRNPYVIDCERGQS